MFVNDFLVIIKCNLCVQFVYCDFLLQLINVYNILISVEINLISGLGKKENGQFEEDFFLGLCI